jgi:hypothetical protein
MSPTARIAVPCPACLLAKVRGNATTLAMLRLAREIRILTPLGWIVWVACPKHLSEIPE